MWGGWVDLAMRFLLVGFILWIGCSGQRAVVDAGSAASHMDFADIERADVWTGITWGSSYKDVLNAVYALDLDVLKQTDNESLIVFAQLAGESLVALRFRDSKLYESDASFVLLDDDERTNFVTSALFKSLNTSISSALGSGSFYGEAPGKRWITDSGLSVVLTEREEVVRVLVRVEGSNVGVEKVGVRM